MWNRLLCAIDQYESGQSALEFVRGVAAASQAEVRILHIRELSNWARVPPLETRADAQQVVEAAVFALQIAGVGAEGRSRSELHDRVAQCIVQESLRFECDAIVLGSRRLRGVARLSGWGTRERVLRLSPLPVIVAPTPVSNGIVSRSKVGIHS